MDDDDALVVQYLSSVVKCHLIGTQQKLFKFVPFSVVHDLTKKVRKITADLYVAANELSSRSQSKKTLTPAELLALARASLLLAQTSYFSF